MSQFELSEFSSSDTFAPYYCEFKAEDIGACLYKIHDDSVRPKHFLGANNENEIEAILTEHEGHSLHKFIDENESLRSIIDFNLPQEVLDTIEPKLTRKEVLDSLALFNSRSNQID